MSVTSVKVKYLTGGQADYKGSRNYTAVFQVETDDPNDGIITVGNAVDPGGLAIPTPGISVYQFNAAETDTSAVCTSIAPERVDDTFTLWLVTANYTNASEPNQDNPLDRPLLINISSQKYEQAVIKDRDGKGIVNTAGDPFDPPLMMDGTRIFLSLTKNFADYNFDLAGAYCDSLNASLYYGFAAEKLKMDGYHASRQFEQDTLFWTVTADFAFRREGWQLQPLNAGLRRKAGSARQKCTDDDGQPVQTPVPLSSAGGQISDPTVDNVVYLAFDVYPVLEFSALGFI